MDRRSISLPLSLLTIETELLLPQETVVLATKQPPALPDVPAALAAALADPMGVADRSPSLRGKPSGATDRPQPWW